MIVYLQRSVSKLTYIFLFLMCVKTFAIEKMVFLAILARNKAHTLPLFLECIEHLEYDKKFITVYINTNDNSDDTEVILEEWIKNNSALYQEIIYDCHNTDTTQITHLHDWNSERFAVLSAIRNKSLRLCQKKGSDFYFVVDCDNFIHSCTLIDLINEHKPIIAPMLKAFPENDDYYSNFFAAVDKRGYYGNVQEYYDILLREKIGTFAVPVVHCTYLIQKEYIPFLSYQDGTDDYEFVIFSRIARKNAIEQYISNKKMYGFLVHFYDNISHQEEVAKTVPCLQTIKERLFTE